jgi:hypothetical protein
MVLTITNHLIRSADTPHTAELGDGGGTVTWLPGRVLTEGQAAAIEIAEATRPIATRRCTTKGSGPAWTPGPGQLGLTGPAAIMQASEVPGAG